MQVLIILVYASSHTAELKALTRQINNHRTVSRRHVTTRLPGKSAIVGQNQNMFLLTLDLILHESKHNLAGR